MNIRESCLQTWTFIYKPGISVTKQDFHLQTGILGLLFTPVTYHHIIKMRFKQSNLSKIVIQFRNIAFKITVNSNPRIPIVNQESALK